MVQYIDKDAVVAEIDRRKSIAAGWDISSTGVNDTEFELWNDFLSFLDTLEVKEVDLELITGWFDHIAQIADDRKTLNGVVMKDWAALDEIKCLARNSAEFIKTHYKRT